MVGLPGGSDGKGSDCNTRDLGLIPGLARSPGGGCGIPTPVFLPGESPWREEPGEYSPWGCKELGMTEWLSTSTICQALFQLSGTHQPEKAKWMVSGVDGGGCRTNYCSQDKPHEGGNMQANIWRGETQHIWVRHVLSKGKSWCKSLAWWVWKVARMSMQLEMSVQWKDIIEFKCHGSLSAGWKRLSRHRAFQKGMHLLKIKSRDNECTCTHCTDLLTDKAELMLFWVSSQFL